MKHKLLTYILLIAGTLVWSATMVKSGIVHDYGMAFWGPNGHDGVWHLALSGSLARISLENPVFAGELLRNYHIGFDLVLAVLTRISGISTSILYFQIFPPMLALSIGLLVNKLVFNWTKSFKATYWALFFVYFGGSFGPLVHLIRYRKWGGDSMFWAQSSATTLINPPFALSLVVMLLGILTLQKYLKEKTLKHMLFTAILFGILIQIKSYAGVLAVASLFTVSIFRFIKEKKIDLFIIFVITFVISLLLFLPLNRLSTGLLVFYPFWFLETLMSFGERLFWERYYLAMINYKASANYLKGIPAYGVAFMMFLVGNLGSRIIGFSWFFQKIKNLRKTDYLSILIATIVVLGIVAPMFLVQKGTPWNTIQFFYYSLFFMGIVSGVFFDKYVTPISPTVRWFVIVVILVITVPTTITTMGHYLPATPPAKISNLELSALKFLKNQPKGLVLTLFLESDKRFLYEGIKAPRPLYLYDSTAYVSAFTNKPTYFDDEVNLNIMGYNWPIRKRLVKDFQVDPNTAAGRGILNTISPEYIYYIKNIGLKGLDENYLGIKNIYDNEEVIVYRRIDVR